jgi:hypothetical protein
VLLFKDLFNEKDFQTNSKIDINTSKIKNNYQIEFKIEKNIFKSFENILVDNIILIAPTFVCTMQVILTNKKTNEVIGKFHLEIGEINLSTVMNTFQIQTSYYPNFKFEQMDFKNLENSSRGKQLKSILNQVIEKLNKILGVEYYIVKNESQNEVIKNIILKTAAESETNVKIQLLSIISNFVSFDSIKKRKIVFELSYQTSERV